MRDIAEATTFLFVPGDRPDRFQKALASGAGLVVVDLEDAVAAANKDAARAHAASWARDHPCLVRINAAGSAWHEDDLAQLAPLGCGIMLPKAERAHDVRRVVTAVGVSRLVALVETARGILDAALTAPDLASARAGLPAPIDGVTAGINDTWQIGDDADYGRRLGFSGKLCIHPKQVGIVADALRSSEAELAWASSIVEAQQDGVGVVNGAMVDRPVIERAERILRLGRITSEPTTIQERDLA
jgi:citrate lyase subunit beta/citryl-CoA lyase